jgi:hypothetical protein
MKNPLVRKISTQTKKFSVVALILLMAAATFAILPVHAQKITTYAFVSVIPETQQPGNYVLVNAWITPPPPIDTKNAPIPYQNFNFVITKPDGNTYTKTIANSDGLGSVWFTYTPDLTGTYSIKLSWAGDETHQAIESPTSTFTVQQQEAPSYPDNPLPSGYWARPI